MFKQLKSELSSGVVGPRLVRMSIAAGGWGEKAFWREFGCNTLE
jgi:hypothetical protein